jgi:hypothetical protein
MPESFQWATPPAAAKSGSIWHLEGGGQCWAAAAHSSRTKHNFRQSNKPNQHPHTPPAHILGLWHDALCVLRQRWQQQQLHEQQRL